MRGHSIGTSASTRAGDAESRKIRSADPIASSMLCVTRSVVTGWRRNQLDEFGAQSRRKRGVERDERLIEHQQFRFDREGARERDAAGKTEREFAGIMARCSASSSVANSVFSAVSLDLRRHEPHVLFDRAPRQQARFLEDHAEPALCRQRDPSFEIAGRARQ